MIFFLVFSYSVLFLYAFFILFILRGWTKTGEFTPTEKFVPLKISVVVAFRNEKDNIINLVEHLFNQDYLSGDYEIIMVDDHSGDGSPERLTPFTPMKNFSLLKLPENLNGKKNALDFGIRNSKYDYILTTDADCIMKREWIKSFAAFYRFSGNPEMIIGLVDYKKTSSWFAMIQNLEFLSLMATGAGAAAMGKPVFCNGANLFFKKEAYLSGSDPMQSHIVSGDDTFLLHDLKKRKDSIIRVLKSKGSVIKTNPSVSLNEFFNQRVRWASKARFYKDRDSVILSLVVLLTNLLYLLSLVMVFYGYFLFIPVFLIKLTGDLLIMRSVLAYFDKIKYLFFFLPMHVLYPLYSGITAVFSLRGNFRWKGRSY